jgi:hypothetical protein
MRRMGHKDGVRASSGFCKNWARGQKDELAVHKNLSRPLIGIDASRLWGAGVEIMRLE